jgi:hypothetical protein
MCARMSECLHAPGRSQGSGMEAEWTTGMTEAGSGRERALRRRYCSTSSSSVGWKRKPGGSCLGASPAGISITALVQLQL